VVKGELSVWAFRRLMFGEFKLFFGEERYALEYAKSDFRRNEP
jgi:hypothetical protein